MRRWQGQRSTISAGYYGAFVAAAVMALVGALVAFTIRDADAASMRPRDASSEGALAPMAH